MEGLWLTGHDRRTEEAFSIWRQETFLVPSGYAAGTAHMLAWPWSGISRRSLTDRTHSLFQRRLVSELKIEQKLSTFVQMGFASFFHTGTLPAAIRFPANKPQVYTTRADKNVIVMGVLTVQ